MDETLRIDPELRDLIPQLTEKEFNQLRENIERDGCRDPITAWRHNGSGAVILDGHNRFEICQEIGSAFRVNYMEFAERDQAVLWMINNQLGRRNLTREDFNMLVGRKYNATKKAANDGGAGTQKATVGQNEPRSRTSEAIAKEHGISEATVRRAATVAAAVDAVKAEAKEAGEPITDKEAIEIVKKPHVAHNSGDNEWYTPQDYIDAAKAVMGAIDMDPASHEAANEIVKAKKYYTQEDDGLAQKWKGRLWMNPPYAGNLIGAFAEKMAAAVESGDVTEAHVLVNNATETRWFARLCSVASCICMPTGRVKFWHPRKVAVPLQGQCVIYIGSNVALFCKQFAGFGIVSVIRK